MAQVNAGNSIRVFPNYHSTKAAKSHVLTRHFYSKYTKKNTVSVELTVRMVNTTCLTCRNSRRERNREPSETRRRSGRRPRRRKVRSAPFPPPGEHFTPLPCSSSPNETRCIAVGGFAALQYGVPLAGAALGSRWVPEPPPDADGVTPGWPRSRSPRSRGPSGWRRRSDRRPRRAGPAAHGRSLRSWSRRTGW